MALLEPLAAKMAEEQFKLIIMDSITALFRSDFTGRGELAERQQRLGQLMHRLRKLADEFNVVRVLSVCIVAIVSLAACALRPSSSSFFSSIQFTTRLTTHHPPTTHRPGRRSS